MGIDNEARLKRIADCRELYVKYRGQHHELIEQGMRERGHTDFHRRVLYRRFERGKLKEGWVGRYGWDGTVRREAIREAGKDAETQGRSDAGISFPASRCPDVPASDLPASPRRRVSVSSSEVEFDDFVRWLKLISPGMDWTFPHQVHIYKYLKRVTCGQLKRLMIFLPPRHGKSELVTKHYAAWRLKLDPTTNIILGSYNQRLVNRFSRGVRAVYARDRALQRQGDAETPGRGDAGISFGAARRSALPASGRPASRSGALPASSSSSFPFTNRPINTEAEWETPEGGGVKAVGVGAGITGHGAHLIIVDDPVKSRAEAESKAYRDRVWDWFNDDLYTRLEPGGAIILIQTRWHEDDLAGRLLRESNEEGGEPWAVINLPALAAGSAGVPAREGAKASYRPIVHHTSRDAGVPHAGAPGVAGGDAFAPVDPLGRAPGEALWPERFDEEALERIRRKIGSYSFTSLYQQRPVAAEGGLLKRAWFRVIDRLPPGIKLKKRGYDPGITNSTGSDYTASAGVAVDTSGNFYIYDVFRRRMEYPELRRYILGRIKEERDTEHGVELSAHGTAIIQDLRKEPGILGRTFRGIKVKADKVTRALPWIALAEEGRIHLVRGAWNRDFIDEAGSFPSGTHDDQIDAVSLAIHLLQSQSRRLWCF